MRKRMKGNKLAKGYKHSKEFKLFQSNRLKGNKNHAWKGGISFEPYCIIWRDKEFREFIKERDNYKCMNPECNKNSNILVLHHIDYNKKNCSIYNIITVFNSCNGKANKDRNWHESWYKAILTKRYGYKYE